MNLVLKDVTLFVAYKKPYDLVAKTVGRFEWRVVVDGRRTLHLQEVQLLVKTTIRKGRRGFVYLGHPLPKSMLSIQQRRLIKTPAKNH